MPLSGTAINMSIFTSLAGAIDLATLKTDLQFTRGFPLDSGTGANQADKAWWDTRTINASSNDDLDLAGSLLDAFGAVLTFVKVKAIGIAASALNTNNVVMGAAASNQFVGPFGAATHTAAVAPGGFQCFARPDGTGWPVVASTGDILRIANGGAGTPVTYDIVIIGTSA